MASDTFVDSSGFYALLSKRDSAHARVRDTLRRAARNKARFVTTDYVLGETATLLLARGSAHVLPDLFGIVLESKACSIEWMDQERFGKTRSYFLKHRDQSWSFTDCFSFLVMKELRLTRALTKDEHFRQAGFTPVL
jgi:predicted nucleic acid-binding protein